MESIDLGQLLAILSQLGFAAGAYRLASALKVRVDNHEERLAKIEVATVVPWSLK